MTWELHIIGSYPSPARACDSSGVRPACADRFPPYLNMEAGNSFGGVLCAAGLQSTVHFDFRDSSERLLPKLRTKSKAITRGVAGLRRTWTEVSA